MLRHIPKYMCTLEFTLQEVVLVVNLLGRMRKNNVSHLGNLGKKQLVIECIANCILAHVTLTQQRLSEQVYEVLFTRCTLSYLRKCKWSMIKCSDVVQLIEDCDDKTTVFESLNQIEAAHEAATLCAENALANASKDLVYVYDVMFKELVEVHGFTCPQSPAALIVRGQQHHNCVARYDEKQTGHIIPYKDTLVLNRLIFSKRATIELQFIIEANTIMAVHVIQCKGARNNNVDEGMPLIHLRCAFVGKPQHILSCITYKQSAINVKEVINNGT